ncbi:MAG: 1-deoxy-D-xylulose-5-phosphate synthase [Proteobacteria bacterium]|nr:1-deoxy-D-xylulose-5-phosphate synthase [Pseudomonadota bacterium]
MARLLDQIDSPADLRRIEVEDLPRLAEEIREEIIATCSRNGGHLAPSLGVVELTIALHYVFDTPRDRVVWDVGHQAYAHKLLTGRRDRFHTMRTYGGLSGFPKRSESEYDTFDTGHSSTSISAALGMSIGLELNKESARTIAVIGDGSLTGGLAYEGLNQAGERGTRLIVILNDNEMSISPNVGALSSFLSRQMTRKGYLALKREVQEFLKTVPGVGENIIQLVKRSEGSFRGFISPSFLFEAFKFEYIGPIRGHRFDRLIEAFNNSKNLDIPVLIHVVTKKGKGYEPAEKNPTHYHGVGAFEIATGNSMKTGSAPPSYTDVFGRFMIEAAERDERIVAITAAMPEGTGLTGFRDRFPNRFFDVGIAEQHAVTFAAGLAVEGLRPVVAIYSTFIQRAFDQVFHDVCLQRLPVVFAMDRGGLVGEDGPTHHGVLDLSFFRALPNMILLAPKDENELRRMLAFCLAHDGPIALRYPRGRGVGVELTDPVEPIESFRAESLRPGRDLLVLAVGSTVYPALEAAETLAAEGIEAAVVNARFIKPLDEALIVQQAQAAGRVLCVEENQILGGFGSAVCELLADKAPGVRVRRLGIPDMCVPHGSQARLRADLGLDAAGIAEAARLLAVDR